MIPNMDFVHAQIRTSITIVRARSGTLSFSNTSLGQRTRSLSASASFSP